MMEQTNLNEESEDCDSVASNVAPANSGQDLVCYVCSKSFSTVWELDSHVFVHANEKSEFKSFQCPQCDKNFLKYSTLRLHMNIHSEENKNECGYCKKRFAILTDLRRHLRTHTGERPYKCSICNKSFGREYTLKIHMLTHSRQVKIYKCKLCQIKFRTRVEINRHYIDMHAGRKGNFYMCNCFCQCFPVKNEFVKHIECCCVSQVEQNAAVATSSCCSSTSQSSDTTTNSSNYTPSTYRLPVPYSYSATSYLMTPTNVLSATPGKKYSDHTNNGKITCNCRNCRCCRPGFTKPFSGKPWVVLQTNTIRQSVQRSQRSMPENSTFKDNVELATQGPSDIQDCSAEVENLSVEQHQSPSLASHELSDVEGSSASSIIVFPVNAADCDFSERPDMMVHWWPDCVEHIIIPSSIVLYHTREILLELRNGPEKLCSMLFDLHADELLKYEYVVTLENNLEPSMKAAFRKTHCDCIANSLIPLIAAKQAYANYSSSGSLANVGLVIDDKTDPSGHIRQKLNNLTKMYKWNMVTFLKMMENWSVKGQSANSKNEWHKLYVWLRNRVTKTSEILLKPSEELYALANDQSNVAALYRKLETYKLCCTDVQNVQDNELAQQMKFVFIARLNSENVMINYTKYCSFILSNIVEESKKGKFTSKPSHVIIIEAGNIMGFTNIFKLLPAQTIVWSSVNAETNIPSCIICAF